MYTKFISKVIQQKMKAKERALSRKSNSSQEATPTDDLTIGDLSSRAVFVRMCSNKSKVPNILIAGGENTSNGMAMGFGETYKDRTQNDDNSGIRGIPGIKNIEAVYKGGFKAIRQCTVSWTIPAIEDLDRLTPYFLTVGKSVVVDWGWTNAKNKTLQEQGIEPFITRRLNTDTNGYDYMVDQEIFSNPQSRIINSGGDYDAIGGVISNFNYTLREDGGFDCTTIITAMGASLFHKPIDVSGNTFGTRKLKNKSSPKHVPPDSLINCILNLKHIIYYDVLKVKHKKVLNQVYANNIKDSRSAVYLLNNNNKNKVWSANSNQYSDPSTKSMYGIAVDDKTNPNILILYTGSVKPKIMVTWGWFEDQILNRYLSFRGGSQQGFGTKLTMRSIDSVLDDNGKPITREEFEWLNDEYEEGQEKSEYQAFIEKYKIDESTFDITEPTEILKTETLIRNPGLLLPINPFKFHILEANFAPADKSVAGIEKGNYTIGLEAIGNKIANLFRRKKNEKKQKLTTDLEDFYKAFFTLISDKYGTNFQNKIFTLPGTLRQKGRLRNIWMNIEEIQTAFGMRDPNSDDNTEENVNPPGTIEVAVKNLLSSMNSNFHNTWKFDLAVDQFDSTNIKVIDTSDTNIDYPSYTKYIENSHKVDELGIYQFPSFKMGSFVKSQNLEFKIPDAQALTILYGSNKKKGENETQQNNAQLDKLFRMDTKDGENDVYADMYLNDLETSNFKTVQDEVVTEGDESFVGPTFNVRAAKVGSEFTNPNSKITEGFGFNVNPSSKSYRWKKFEPNTEKPGTTKTTKETTEFYEVRRDSRGRAILQYIIAEKGENGEDVTPLSSESKPYYDPPNDNNEIVLNQSATAALNTFINASAPIAQFDMNSLVPTELNLEIDGTGGILPGDIVHTEYIQHKYKVNIKQNFKDGAGEDTTLFEGPLCYFQLFGVTHKVSEAGWTAELTSKMTINRMPEGASLEYTIPTDTPRKPLGPTTNKVLEPPLEKEFTPIPSDTNVDIEGDVDEGDTSFDVFEDVPEFDNVPLPDVPRPRIPIPMEEEDILGDQKLEDLDSDDIPLWLPPPYSSTLPLRRTEIEIENKPERVSGGDIPPDVKLLDIGPMMTEEDFLNIPDNLGVDASDNNTDLVKYPPKPDPRAEPAIPSQPIRIGGDYGNLNPLSLLDQINSQRINYVQPAFDLVNETGEVEKPQVFEAPQVQELNFESPVKATTAVNENIKKELPEEIVVETPQELNFIELKSTYKFQYEQNEILYALREDWRPLYQKDDGSLTGRKFKLDSNRKKIPIPNTNPVQYEEFRQVRPGQPQAVRQAYWDAYIEGKNKDGVSKTKFVDRDNFQIFPPVEPTGDLVRRDRGTFWEGEFNPKYPLPPI